VRSFDQNTDSTIVFAKTLLTAKRRKLFMPKGRTYLGVFYLAKGKAFEKGENLSNLKMLLKNSILVP
jgi:hypothetical protein